MGGILICGWHSSNSWKKKEAGKTFQEPWRKRWLMNDGMKINTKKMKVLVCIKNSHAGIKIYLERNYKIEQVENITCLGSTYYKYG